MSLLFAMHKKERKNDVYIDTPFLFLKTNQRSLYHHLLKFELFLDVWNWKRQWMLAHPFFPPISRNCFLRW